MRGSKNADQNSIDFADKDGGGSNNPKVLWTSHMEAPKEQKSRQANEIQLDTVPVVHAASAGWRCWRRTRRTAPAASAAATTTTPGFGCGLCCHCHCHCRRCHSSSYAATFASAAAAAAIASWLSLPFSALRLKRRHFLIFHSLVRLLSSLKVLPMFHRQ